jgi:hypothetical protein
MHIRVFSASQIRHAAQAIYEYWDSSRVMFRTRSLQLMSQLRAGETAGFRGYVSELVLLFFL